MFETHNIDDIIETAGGKFRTTCLIQKRLKGLAVGEAQTIAFDDRKLFSQVEIVFEEIMRDNIELTFAESGKDDSDSDSDNGESERQAIYAEYNV